MSFYILVCLSFVFFAMMEYAYLLALRQKIKLRAARNKIENNTTLESGEKPKKSSWSQQQSDVLVSNRLSVSTHRIDKYAFMFFSMAFFVFNLTYAAVYFV